MAQEQSMPPVTATPPSATAPTPQRPRRAAGGAERVFLEMLDRHVEDTSIRFIVRGEEVAVGKGGRDGSPAVRIHDDRFFARVLSGGNLGLGEAYMDGDWEMEEGDLEDLLTPLLRNRIDRKVKGDVATAARWRACRSPTSSAARTGGTRSSTTTWATRCSSRSWTR
jgi:hypothetical protein